MVKLGLTSLKLLQRSTIFYAPKLSLRAAQLRFYNIVKYARNNAKDRKRKCCWFT